MPTGLTRDETARLLASGGQVVDVRSAAEYEELHVAGAVSIPLAELGARAPEELDPARPVAAYCHDFL